MTTHKTNPRWHTNTNSIPFPSDVSYNKMRVSIMQCCKTQHQQPQLHQVRFVLSSSMTMILWRIPFRPTSSRSFMSKSEGEVSSVSHLPFLLLCTSTDTTLCIAVTQPNVYTSQDSSTVQDSFPTSALLTNSNDSPCSLATDLETDVYTPSVIEPLASTASRLFVDWSWDASQTAFTMNQMLPEESIHPHSSLSRARPIS